MEINCKNDARQQQEFNPLVGFEEVVKDEICRAFDECDEVKKLYKRFDTRAYAYEHFVDSFRKRLDIECSQQRGKIVLRIEFDRQKFFVDIQNGCQQYFITCMRRDKAQKWYAELTDATKSNPINDLIIDSEKQTIMRRNLGPRMFLNLILEEAEESICDILDERLAAAGG